MELDTLEVERAAQWRSWLKNNHHGKHGVWLVFRKGGTAKSIGYDEALDEALAYGWIDSVIRKIDDGRYARKFTPRRPWSIWSSRNIDRIEKLKAEGRVTKWGLEAFSKRTSEISMLEKVNAEGAKIPEDLQIALSANKRARDNFAKFGLGYRKKYLVWISGAKRPATRKKRIAEAVDLISQNVKDLLK